MEIESCKKWYLTRSFRFIEINRVFTELGVLLIDGDALIYFLDRHFKPTKTSNRLEALKYEINKFLKILLERGFKSIKIVFFGVLSNFTGTNLEKLFDFNQLLLFDGLDDIEWNEYIRNEHVCLFITSDSNIYKTKEVQYSFIRKICLSMNIQVALINNLACIQFSIYAFLLFSNKPVKNLLSISDKELNTIEAKILVPKQNNPDQSLTWRHLGDPLGKRIFQDCDPKLLYTEKSEDELKIAWELKLSYKEEEKSLSQIRNSNRGKQTYYRYIEKYSNSLNASKNLHQKIILVDSSNKSNKVKVSKFKNENEFKKINQSPDLVKKNIKEECNQMQVFEEIETSTKSFEDLEVRIRMANNSWQKYCSKFWFNLEVLKIKRLNYEGKNQESNSLLFRLIKDLFYDHHYQLIESCEVIIENLKILVDREFHSTALYLKKFILEKINLQSIAESKAKTKNIENIQSFEVSKNTFNNDVLFQLKYLGEYLPRTLNTQVDKRVLFRPDDWQKQLLDAVDNRESVLVCCPTSSGKTFISYYAMEQSLRVSNEDMVVFVSPMKSLANQVAAEVYARFGSKPYPKNSTKTVYAMSMPDYEVNNPQNCQILITVPTTFESILSENGRWTQNIKYIVIDEIQTINELELGTSLEKIIHFAQCPIIALSATIGNLDKFFDWMKKTQAAKNIRTTKIVHSERFCDLKKFTFVPNKLNFIPIGSTKSTSLVPIHELFGYSEAVFAPEGKTSEDFNFLPSEIVQVLEVLEEIACTNEQKIRVKSVQPDKFFECVLLTKNDAKRYEQFLIAKLKEWYQGDVFNLKHLARLIALINQDSTKAFELCQKEYGDKFSCKSWMVEHISELVQDLKINSLLPAIVFLSSSEACNQLALELTRHLEVIEAENSKVTKADLKKVDKQEKALRRSKNRKDENNNEKSSKVIEDEDLELKNSNELNIKYTFLDPKYKMTFQEIDDEINIHRHRKNIPKEMFEAWKRGIGVHHASFHTKFRSSVECLFRRRHLQIVFATKTLSLGLNMPCKTVVLPSEAMCFDSIYYRHMVGRAGRRGFDNIGHIIYYGMPEKKIKNFISSNVSQITGLFTFNLNLILQISAMNQKNSKALQILRSMTENPILMLSTSNFESTDCQTIVRRQISYLISKEWLSEDFRISSKVIMLLELRNENIPINKIQNLLDCKYFDRLCNQSENESVELRAQQIFLVLSHFIQVIYINPQQASLIRTHLKKSIILPKMDIYLMRCLESENISESIIQGEDEKNNSFLTESLKMAFPSYVFNMDKNSYLYEFYQCPDIKDIDKNNNVDDTTLWYGMKAARLLLTVLCNNIQSNENSLVKESFKFCLNRVAERFFQITN